MTIFMKPNLILASSSPYRKQLLERLRLPFECDSPNIDESPYLDETPEKLVKRLAYEKAITIGRASSPNYVVIASDQVATLDGLILGKPHTVFNATQQLLQFSGRKVSFLTSLCVLNNASQSYDIEVESYHVHFRALSIEEISHYISMEMPLDCAGSFKCEGLGVCLFEKMEGDDPNSLIGLPLIALSRLLKKHGINPLAQKNAEQ